MKRLSVLLIASILLTCLASVCHAAGAEVSIGNASGKKGDTVEVSLVLSGNTGFASLGLEIGYDASALELVDVTEESSVGATVTKAQEFTDNPYNIGWDSAENVSYNGTLAVFRFKILAENGEYPVTVSYYKGRNGDYTDGYDTNYDESFEDIGLSYSGGKITVIGKKAFAITDFSSTGGIKFNVSVPEEKGYLIAAVFDSTGKMVDVKLKQAKDGVDFSLGSGGAELKVLWVDSALRPVSNPLIKQL